MARGKNIDIAKLREAIRASRQGLEPYRAERLKALKQYAGGRYGEGGAREKVPVNLIATYVSVTLRSLVPQNPRALLSTFSKDIKPLVAAMESSINRRIRRMKLDETLRKAVCDAEFCLGIIKVALSTPSDAMAAGWGLAAGTAFAERVDFDDFVYDIHARDFAAASFIGHRYRAPLESVRTAPYFNREARGKVVASEDPRYNEAGDERADAMSKGDSGWNEEFEEYVDLWEIYFPRQRCIYTLTYDEADGVGLLREQDWLGPESGPYHFLSFMPVPGNAIGKAPIPDLLDLHLLVNNIWRKLDRQARAQKSVAVVQRMAGEDGSRLVEANDGEMIGVDNAAAVAVLKFGGVDPNNALFGTAAIDRFSEQAGNLKLLAGSGPQSKTATQDKLLNENASLTMADMQAATLKFTASVIEALCWYWHKDPFATMRTQYSVPGMPDFSVEQQVTADQRAQVPFEELDIAVDPYSMQHQTPQGRAQQLNSVVQNIVTPLLPALMQQGVMFDINAFLAKLAKLLDMPDLAEIVTIMEPPQSMTGAEPPGMAANTSRTYTRQGTGGDSQQGRENEFSNMMSAAAAQDGGGMMQRNGQMGY